MKEAWFSIAGVNFDFISHGAAAEYLFDELPGLLSGFLISKKKTPDAVCLVHFDHELTYLQRFDSEPHLIRREDSNINEAIFARIDKITFSSLKNYSEAIGFLNGCLIFDDRTNRGLIYIFCSDEANHFVGTLLKLLFVFTCLVMVNRGRLMVHGAGIKKRKGRGGYLFLGTSGTGKSTVAALSSGDIVLSDDATVIEDAGDACHIHATPFRQVGGDQPSPKRLYLQQEKLDKLLFLHQSAMTSIQSREQRNAFTELLKEHLHCFEVMGEPLKRQAFYLCRDVCEMTAAYDLFFRKDPGFWELVVAK
ncbi:MAG: hypothetical protein NTV58_16325 [Deltaproteobacteria bacterium]|nr:hypothetical protein [Deltaproteobacteria bacterium]